MTMDYNIKCKRIEVLLDEIIGLILDEIGTNPYDDLEKAKKIVSQRNINQIDLVIKKLDNFSMLLYNRSLDNSKIIIDKLNEIYSLINSISIG